MDKSDATSQPATSEHVATVPNSPESETRHTTVIEDATTVKDTELIGELIPMNRAAKDSFHFLACRRDMAFYEHQCSFIRVDAIEATKLVGCFVFSLSNLPQYAPKGWKIGRGRTDLKNLGVDLLLIVDGKDDSIGGVHARFAWLNGGGGFFLVADNIRGKTVTLNGEVLTREKRLIPYRNTIGIGECYFTLKFPTRTAKQDEQFQVELAAFYRHVMQDSVPLIAPTPCEHEVMMGDWVVRNAIAKGTFGHVYAVTHTHTGKAAAAKELWRTLQNSRNVDQEVSMAQHLLGIKHEYLATPFDFHHELVHNKVEKARITMLLDDTWKPGSNDVVDKYTFFSPLSTSTFHSLISSNATEETRTILFAQVLEGIAFLHEKGITHRDIKPANLTVQSYDPPLAKVIDFGSATAQKRILYDRPGTIPYLAPEQRQGEYHGCYVDYWACALVGLGILGHELPRRQVNEQDYHKIHKWLGQKPVRPLVSWCKFMLQWAPDQRLTTNSVLQQYPYAQCREHSAGKKRKLI